MQQWCQDLVTLKWCFDPTWLNRKSTTILLVSGFYRCPSTVMWQNAASPSSTVVSGVTWWKPAAEDGLADWNYMQRQSILTFLGGRLMWLLCFYSMEKAVSAVCLSSLSIIQMVLLEASKDALVDCICKATPDRFDKVWSSCLICASMYFYLLLSLCLQSCCLLRLYIAVLVSSITTHGICKIHIRHIKS